MLRSSSDVDPAVNIEGLPCDVVAVLDQEAHCAGDLFWLTEAPQGDRLQELLSLVIGDAGYHIGLYEPGADRVHGYAVAGEFLGGGLGEAEQAGFGRRVVGLADIASLADEGAHVDDLASALLHHVRQRRVHGVEGAIQVHLDDLVPVLHRELPQRAVYVYPGVVDQHVYPVELLYRPVYEALGLVWIRDVSLYRYGLPTVLGDLTDQLLRRFLAPRVVDHDLGPATSHLLRDRAAQTPAGPSNNHNGFLQSAHQLLPSLGSLQHKFIDRGNPVQTMYDPHIRRDTRPHWEKRYPSSRWCEGR